MIQVTQGAGALPARRLVELGDQRGQVQQRRREDDRHDAGHVHLDRDVRVIAAVRSAAHHALGVLHRDAALRLLDEDDGGDDQETDRNHHQHHLDALRLADGPEGARELRRDRGEDQEGHTVADAALGDELTHPHDEAGAGGHGDDHEHDGVPGVVRDELRALRDGRGAEEGAGAGDGDEGRRLEDAQRDREIAGVLRELRLAGLALLVEGLEAWDDHAQQLHDDRRGDVRHDAEREDREFEESATREQIDQGVEP
ncbi:hypothetical protein ABH923_001356 [Leifsonia sp. EB41]